MLNSFVENSANYFWTFGSEKNSSAVWNKLFFEASLYNVVLYEFYITHDFPPHINANQTN